MLKHLIEKSIKDPRSNRIKRYSLYEILCISLLAIISDETTYVGIEEFGNLHQKELSEYFEIHNIPSHDTIRLIFNQINPEDFICLFNEFLHIFLPVSSEIKDTIAIDGKTIKNSNSSNNLLHVVSAWSSENRLILAHEKTKGKGTEIEGLKKIIKLMNIEGHIVTTDALGCQKGIAKQIVEQKGDYVLQTKLNQKNLLETMKPYFDDEKLFTKEIVVDKIRGWVQESTTIVCEDIDFLKENCKNFESISTIIKVIKVQTKNNITKKEERYYISSLKASPLEFHKIIKSHWGIENNVHWTLDVRLNEDKSCIRSNFSPENMNILKKIALNIMYSIQKVHTKHITLKSIQRKFKKPEEAKKLLNLLKFFHS